MAQQRWGTTDPISMDLPTDQDLKLNDALLAELRAQNNFPSSEDTEQRKRVLTHLQKVTEELVRSVGKKKGLSQSAIDSAGGKVFTFGSYRLGVYGPGSDIDTLIIAPKHVTRDDFFEYFPSLLEKMSPAAAIEELTPVPDAHVPIIKLEYSGVSVDLIFAKLAASSIPSDIDLKDDTWLRGLDDVDMRCINGTRVTDQLLSLVPEVKSFRLALRAVKLWAQRRAIYANVMGFPGGIAWALMVARICQLYPRAAGATVVAKFFSLMKSWNWPTPVRLTAFSEGPSSIRLNVRVWNPAIYSGDANHIMPVITPAYPQMCATHNIMQSTKTVIQRELARADEIMADIIMGLKSWKDLFAKHTFFVNGYKHYLAIVTASPSKEAQSQWSGSVQSRIRRLVSAIDTSSMSIGVELAHPFNKGFDRVHRCKPENISDILMGSLQYQVKDIPTEVGASNITQATAAADEGRAMTLPEVNGVKTDAEGLMEYHSTTFYIGLQVPPKDDKKLDISGPVHQFRTFCNDLTGFNPDLNFVKVTYMRDFNLPDDVFEPGEQRPTKKTKKVKAAKAPNGTAPPQKTTGKKRKSDADSTSQESAAKRQNLGANQYAASPPPTAQA